MPCFTSNIADMTLLAGFVSEPVASVIRKAMSRVLPACPLSGTYENKAVDVSPDAIPAISFPPATLPSTVKSILKLPDAVVPVFATDTSKSATSSVRHSLGPAMPVRLSSLANRSPVSDTLSIWMQLSGRT